MNLFSAERDTCERQNLVTGWDFEGGLESRSPLLQCFDMIHHLLFTRMETAADRGVVSQDPGNGEGYFQFVI